MARLIYICIAGIAFVLCSCIEAAAWPTLESLHLTQGSIAVLAYTAVYLVLFAWEWPFSPPSPQRGAFHGLLLSSYWWLAGCCLAIASVLGEAARKPWIRISIALGCLGIVVNVASMLRMWLVDYKIRAKALRRRRERAKQGNMPRNPIALAQGDDVEEFTCE